MLRTLIFVIATVVSIQASATGDGSFACFRELNGLNTNHNFLGKNRAFAIGFLSDYSFNVMTDSKVDVCDLPPHPQSTHHAGPPFRVKILIANKPHYFTFSREEVVEVLNPKDPARYSKANCSAATSVIASGTFKGAIENQLQDANEYCNSGIKNSDETTGGSEGRCYDNIETALKVCARAKNAQLKTFAKEAMNANEARMANPNQNFDEESASASEANH